MPVEFSYLVASIILYAVMIVVQAVLGVFEHKPMPLFGARDGLTDKGVMLCRAKRANANMVEALLIFVPLLLVAFSLDRFNETTALGAMLFFFGRLAYAPLYWLGVPFLRTLAWAVALVGAILVLLQVIPFSGA